MVCVLLIGTYIFVFMLYYWEIINYYVRIIHTIRKVQSYFLEIETIFDNSDPRQPIS